MCPCLEGLKVRLVVESGCSLGCNGLVGVLSSVLW